MNYENGQMHRVIVYEEKCFFASLFRNNSKTAETILIKKIGRNYGVLVYKKAQIREHQKNHIFRDINCFVKMSFNTLPITLKLV